ncbi:ASCH domain-containing protein [Streptomyces sp. NPDC014995]|uniref:ASCH domain-containing protein n=1 Tax=Streptomyces sp. NPDC014995 TaxID=3364936 RepID=UPI003702FDD7
MRAMELGIADRIRVRLNSPVLSGRRTATTGLLAEYPEETEGLEYVGERLALLDGDGRSVATVEITGAEGTTFAGVTREHAAAEGEGDAGLEEWRAGHRRFRSAQARRCGTTRPWCARRSGWVEEKA